ncbi:MAG: DTW domain-containing protein [Proteobacteria bacterium]|nr:DTW domain-containing protein [Pseudomonadota bacterium]
MSVRKKYGQRCDRCFMKTEICICHLIPKIQVQTKLVVIVGKREELVPTNTGRLATLALTNSVTLIHGDLARPLNLRDHLSEDTFPLLLYPSPDAEILTHTYLSNISQPVSLIVPDSNWRQANKMRRRNEIMRDIPIVKLASGEPTRYMVRKENQAEGLATIEAIARAMGIIEGIEVQTKLENLMDEMVKRVMKSRGVKTQD